MQEWNVLWNERLSGIVYIKKGLKLDEERTALPVTKQIEIYNHIASYLAEAELIAPDEKVRFLEILRKERKTWR